MAPAGTTEDAWTRQPVEPVTGRELLAVVSGVCAPFFAGLLALHGWGTAWRAQQAPGDAVVSGFWGTLPSAWDHPEPNYMVSSGIGEFWSVLTTVPVAGAMLTFQGMRYRYDKKILRIYWLTVGMYSLAFTAHLTLQKLVFSTTVTAVMSNALLTFAQFSPVVHRYLGSVALRGAIVTAAEILLISTVATLPYALPEHGGVWTLFTVQAPGVFLATGLGAAMAWRAKDPQEKVTYRLVTMAGSFLSSAMVLSLVECLIGFEHGWSETLWGFPHLHIAIHVLEQMGIYLFGVGVACLHEFVLRRPVQAGAEVRWIGGFVPSLHLPAPTGEEAAVVPPPPSGAPALASASGGTSGAKGQTEEPEPRSPSKDAARGRSMETSKDDTTPIRRRRRDKTPGVVAVATRPANGD